MTLPTTTDTRLITQRDLAALCKVSVMTVSNALREKGRVRPEVAAKIIAVAREHGYSPDAHFSACALSGRRRHGRQAVTKVICAVVREMCDDDRVFNGRILRGIESTIDFNGDGSELIVAHNVKGARLPRVVTRRQADGLVWVLNDLALRSGQLHCPVPWISVLYDVPEADVVLVDNADGGRQLGEHLAGLGHRRVAFVGPESGLARERLAGLRDALAAAGGAMPDEYVATEPYAGGEAEVLPLLRQMMAAAQARPAAERFTAVAVYNDWQAGPVVRCLEQEFGRRVPQDLSVTGFDGLKQVPGTTRRLTTAAIPLEEVGAEAGRLLNWRLGNPGLPRQQRLVKTKLVAGETTGPANPTPDSRRPFPET